MAAPVHLIAKTPEPDAVGILHPVASSQVAVHRPRREIAVFQILQGFLHPSGSQIHSKNGLHLRLLCPMHKFVRPKLVCLNCFPCKVNFSGTLPAWSHTVLPMVSRHKISARVTHRRNAHISDRLQHIRPESLLVCADMPRLIYAVIDHSPHMFQK